MATRFYSNVEYSSSRASVDPEVLYFNATINNNNTEDPERNDSDPQVVASYQRQFPLIQDASDYMCSVVRLSTNGATRNLPLLIPRIQTSGAGEQWIANLSGNTMVVTSGNPTLYPGLVIGGSGRASIFSGSTFIGTINVAIGTGANGLPLSILNAPVPPSTNTWTLSSTIPPVFYPGDSTHPPGFYPVTSIVGANLFVGVSQNDVDKTIYSFNINGTETFVEWVTQEPGAPEPTAPVITQQLGSSYYFCYSYDWWVSLCNVALNTAYVASGSPGTGPPTLNYIITEGNSLLFYFKPAGADVIGTTYQLFMNSNMANLFPNFPGTWENLSNGQTFKLKASANGTLNGSTGIPAGSSQQEFPGTAGWSPIDALVVTTSQVPIVSEQVTPPSLIGVSDYGFNRGVSEAAFQPILVDVTLAELNGAEDWRSNFIFEPTGEYRMISLTTQSSPISSVDFQVWWRNRLDDGLYPLRLSNGSSLSLKLMFRRKQMGV